MKARNAVFAWATIAIVSTTVWLWTIGTPSLRADAIDVFSGRDLYQGTTGTDVMYLQALLSEQGYLNVPVGVPLGYFGSLTQSALARYQASIGVSPALGYFGPVTKARMSKVFLDRGWLALLD